jgi:hypothetical protein
MLAGAATVGKGKGRAKGKAAAAKKKPAKAPLSAEALAAVGNDNADSEASSEASSHSQEDADDKEGDDAASKPLKMAVLKPPGAGSKPGKVTKYNHTCMQPVFLCDLIFELLVGVLLEMCHRSCWSFVITPAERAGLCWFLKSVWRQGAVKMEGVGLGAVAAAKAYANFDSAELATWKAGEPVPFLFLATTFEAIANQPKRLQMTQLLVTAFRTILATTPEDLLPAVYLCSNQVERLRTPSPL